MNNGIAFKRHVVVNFLNPELHFLVFSIDPNDTIQHVLKTNFNYVVYSCFFRAFIYSWIFLSVVYLVVANLVQREISTSCNVPARSQYLVRFLFLC